MDVCGIIAEYNPFHSGHAHQCAQARAMISGCAVLSVMSGNYVQRGEPAIWEKYQRAELAIRSGGPDLIVELALPAALSSAEYFAKGGVQQLLATGIVTHLSFGSECGDTTLLQRAAHISDSAAFFDARQQHLRSGLGYAAASEAAMRELAPDCAPLLTSPNDTLGIQYLRASNGTAVTPLPIRRIGAPHDGAPVHSVPSASWLRQKMHAQEDVQKYFSVDTSTWTRHAISEYEREIMAYLRRLSPEQWRAVCGVSEGLEFRLFRAVRDSASFSDTVQAASAKRYPTSRIRRLLLCAYLGITQKLAALPPQYLRVLAFNDTGRTLLREMKRSCAIPVITKPLTAKTLVGSARQLWELDMLADDLYHNSQPCGSGWRQNPFFLR